MPAAVQDFDGGDWLLWLLKGDVCLIIFCVFVLLWKIPRLIFHDLTKKIPDKRTVHGWLDVTHYLFDKPGGFSFDRSKTISMQWSRESRNIQLPEEARAVLQKEAILAYDGSGLYIAFTAPTFRKYSYWCEPGSEAARMGLADGSQVKSSDLFKRADYVMLNDAASPIVQKRKAEAAQREKEQREREAAAAAEKRRKEEEERKRLEEQRRAEAARKKKFDALEDW
jgi:hypothetical protein